MRQVMYLPFETNHASVYNRSYFNSSFDQGSLKVLYTGPNRNHTVISRSTVEAALPSLYNIPIVAHYDPNINQIGGHDTEVRIRADGMAELHALTVPCGVVPEHAAFSFQEDEDEYGNKHEYLVIDGVLLWKREDVYRHIVEDLDGKVEHSMEIGVMDGAFDESIGMYEIKSFEFQALCLLERDEPCFEGSVLELFSLNDFRARMAEMMEDFKQSYSMVPSEQEDDRNHSEEGGDTLEEAMEPIVSEEAAEAVETENEAVMVEEPAEEYSVQEASEAIEEESYSVEEPAEEPAEESDAEPVKDYALDSDICNELCRVVSEEKIEQPWGLCSRYFLVDFDQDLGEVYVQDCSDWLLYGFRYFMNGDRAVVDFASKHRVKYAIVPFDEGSVDQGASVFSKIAEQFASEIETLRAFKAETERKEDEAARIAVFASFHDLDGVEDFEDLKENNSACDIETLREKCYAIRGKISEVVTFSAAPSAIKLPIERKTYAEEPYGGVVTRYRKH